MVRFFSRFNDGLITDFLDDKTSKAIAHFKDLRQQGITGERIYMEFHCWHQSKLKILEMFLKNCVALGLMPTIFPNMNVDITGIDRVGRQ